MANLYSEQPRRQQMRAFVRAHPNCTTREVADAFGMDSRRVGSELEQLKSWGFIESIKVGRYMHWTCTDKPPSTHERGFVPHQHTRTSWTPHMTRHWLDVALFGAPA